MCSLHLQLAESFQEFQVSTQYFSSTAAEEVQGCRSWYLYGQLRHGAGMEALEHSHPYSTSCISKHATQKHYFKSCPRFTQLPRARSTFIPALTSLLALPSQLGQERARLLCSVGQDPRQGAVLPTSHPPWANSSPQLGPCLPTAALYRQATLHHRYTIAETTTTKSLLKTVRKISLSFFLITSCT